MIWFLLDQIEHKLLLEEMYSKLYSTYIEGLKNNVLEDGKIHTIFTQTLTRTGRLSSISPNLQNIPVKQEEGKLIRKAFVSSYDYLISFDYSQIELRILAHLADVKSLLEAFNNNKDIHSHTAALIFNVDDEDVTSDMRRKAKAVNFGIIYGMGEFRLSKEIGVSLKEAKGFIEKYFEQYPEIRVFMDKVVEDCKKDGFVSTVLNRKRYIPTINDKNYIILLQVNKDDKLKLEGYSNSDKDIIEKFDITYNDSDLIKGLKTIKDGSFSSNSKVLNDSDFDSLIKLASDKIDETIDNVLNANFDINPIKKESGQGIDACEYCNFKDICFRTNKDIKNLKKDKDLSFLGGDTNA